MPIFSRENGQNTKILEGRHFGMIRKVTRRAKHFKYYKTGARQYTRAVLSIFAEIHSTHPISAYIFLLSPTLGLPPRFIDALFGVTGISGLNL